MNKISQLCMSNYNGEKPINLLLLENKHYIFIKNFKSLVTFII